MKQASEKLKRVPCSYCGAELKDRMVILYSGHRVGVGICNECILGLVETLHSYGEGLNGGNETH